MTSEANCCIPWSMVENFCISSTRDCQDTVRHCHCALASWAVATHFPCFSMTNIDNSGLLQHGYKFTACNFAFIARIHSQFESLGFVGKYDQSPTNIVNSWTLKYGVADFLWNPRIFSLQNGPRMRAHANHKPVLHHWLSYHLTHHSEGMVIFKI
jgi:hypothetical protein